MIVDDVTAIIPLSKGKADPWALVKPFGWEVWLGITLSVPAVILAIGLMDKESTD